MREARERTLRQVTSLPSHCTALSVWALRSSATPEKAADPWHRHQLFTEHGTAQAGLFCHCRGCGGRVEVTVLAKEKTSHPTTAQNCKHPQVCCSVVSTCLISHRETTSSQGMLHPGTQLWSPSVIWMHGADFVQD